MTRLRVQVGGALGTASDWSNSYEFILTGPVANQAALQSLATAIFTAVTTSTPYRTGIMIDETIASVKLLHYASNTGSANLVAQSTGAPVAGLGPATHAPQVAVVASLRTAVAGRSTRGRLYIPYRNAAISALGVVSSAAQDIINAHVQAMVTAVGTALASTGLNASWVVWSPKLGSGAPITAILVGTQCDTIRHRNRNRTESYKSYTPPAIVAQAPDQASLDQIDVAKAHFVGPSGINPQIEQAAGIVIDGFLAGE